MERVVTESTALDSNSQKHVPSSKSSPEFPPVKILVRDEDGNPLKGVRVSLFQGATKEGGKIIEINATSNENGIAVERILPFGNYSLTLMTSEGWQLSGNRVNVEFETGLSTTIVAPSPNKRAKLVVELNDKLHSRPSLNKLRFGELQDQRVGNPAFSTDLLPEPGEELGGYEFFPTTVMESKRWRLESVSKFAEPLSNRPSRRRVLGPSGGGTHRTILKPAVYS